jgi:hypothetical protein
MNRTRMAFRVAAWSCVVLIAVLSLLPAEEMVRTSLGGHVEHMLAYAGTAFITGLAYPQTRLGRITLTLICYAGF